MSRRLYIQLLLLICCMTAYSSTVFAQQLVLSGRIKFERRENMHKQFADDEDNRWSEEMKKRMPKYKLDKFELTFNKNQSLYKVTEEDDNPFFTWGRVASANTVKIDLAAKRYAAVKNVFDRDYLVEDSLPEMKWKMLDEYRTIAGYNCRKAATIIMDSVYIIAFYTDEIPVSAGPESFQGLPGMVLGIVVPRIGLTYFATEVSVASISEKELVFTPSNKTHKVNQHTLLEELKKGLKDWGEYATKVMWKSVL